MPITPNVGTNIKNLYAAKKNPSLSSVSQVAAKRPRKQIIAIAEAEARKANGGSTQAPQGASFPHPFTQRSP